MWPATNSPEKPPQNKTPQSAGSCRWAHQTAGGSGGTEAIRTRLLIVSRALSGEGSTGVRHAASPMSRPRHVRLIGESQGDTSALRPAALPLGRFGDQPLGRWGQFWVLSGRGVDAAPVDAVAKPGRAHLKRAPLLRSALSVCC